MSPTIDWSDAEAEELTRQMVYRDPLVWWENYVEIEDKDHQLIRPVANVLQERVAECVRYCRANRLPIRIVILKPRQKGISTITVGIMQWLQKVKPRDALLVGGKDWQVDNLWEIYRRYALTDTFPWGFGGYVEEEYAEWGNGSKLRRQTAGGKDPGRSGTAQVLIGTEVAYWGHDTSLKNAGGVLTSLLASLGSGEDTMAVLESTSSGGSGMFWRRWEDSVDLKDFLKGARSASGFVRIFAGWHEFPDSYIEPRDSKEASEIMAGVGARNEEERRRERELRVRYGLTAGQIKYYRQKLSDCDNDPDKRDREYPTTPEDAFRAAQPCRFNRAMLRRLRDEAAGVSSQVRLGMLDKVDKDQDRYIWRDCMEEIDANFWLWEEPREGMRYTIPVDNAGGRATGEDKADTDCHAVPVIREGYYDANRGGWVRPAVVACIKARQRVNIDILEEWVWRLSVWYGRCLVVPEANNDRGLIRGLKKRGAKIYEEERPATDKESSKPSGKLGFWTKGRGDANRRWIIENLARAIREVGTDGDGIFIPFPHILDELDHFVTDPDTGKDEAMSGWHDDWVLALAIGMATKAGGTVYRLPEVELALPRDIALLQQTGLGGGGADRI